MMLKKQTERLLDGFLESLASALGFRRTESLDYARKANDATATLSFPCRVDARGFAAFSCLVGVRFESLSRWLDDDRPEKVATLATPIHFLREDRSFMEWKFSGADDLQGLRNVIWSDLNNLALPFIEKYSRLDELEKTLESPNPRDWFNLSVDSRVNVLAVIHLIQGDKSGAIKILDDALLARRTALPKSRSEIECLRKRLAETA